MRRRSLSRTRGIKATKDSGRLSPTSFRHLDIEVEVNAVDAEYSKLKCSFTQIKLLNLV